MQMKGKIAALIAAITVVGSTGGVYAEDEIILKRETSLLNPITMLRLRIWSNPDLVWRYRVILPLELDNDETEIKSEVVPEAMAEPTPEPTPTPIPQPKYGVDFTRIREKYPNKPFVKKVLTKEMEEYLNQREVETGIPGAVIMAQAIWEVGWDLKTPKGNGRDSRNLFNIKNCDGNYVVMAGSRWQCYDSYIASVDAYIKLITTQPRYAKAYEHIKNGGDMNTYYRMLGDAGYYEAPKDTYSGNCMSIIKANRLIANA